MVVMGQVAEAHHNRSSISFNLSHSGDVSSSSCTIMCFVVE